MTFVFYDTETTGIDTSFDQILQFGAIRTDNDLNETDRFETRCRLLPHVVPAPMALAVTRVTPAMLEDPSLPSHLEAMRRIAQKLDEWSPACIAGYNSLSFDENLLRQAFFQTLHPPYLTNTNGNIRADVYRMVLAVSVHSPSTLKIPFGPNGKPSRKLDALAPANGFDHTNAHDALGDVEATIFIARLIRDRAPHLWSAIMDTTVKSRVVERLLDDRPIVQTEVFGQSVQNRLVVGLACNPDYNAEVGVFDLSFDPESYMDLPLEGLVDTINGKPKPIRVVRANAQPILIDPSIVEDGVMRELPDPQEGARRADLVLGNQGFRKRVGEALSQRYPEREPGQWVEEQIYDGFIGSADSQRMREFHAAQPSERIKIAHMFEDRRLKELAFRQIYFEAPEALEPKLRGWFENWQMQRVTNPDGKDGVRSWASAHADALKLAEDPRDFDNGFVREITDWFASKANQFGPNQGC
tara:strand:+ start:29168 stop:30577 length:1410 start_codon:yes stop_codon:yes gene_type:complete